MGLVRERRQAYAERHHPDNLDANAASFEA